MKRLAAECLAWAGVAVGVVSAGLFWASERVGR